MSAIERSFHMEAAPEAAQARFVQELGPPLHSLGYRVHSEAPGHIVFRPRYTGGVTFFGVVTIAYWLIRIALGHNIEVDVKPDGTGANVEVYGRAGREMRDRVHVLGRRGHWPANLDDPDWLPERADDRYREWDQTDGQSPQDMDRITRRALQKAGRLPPER